MSVPHQRCGPNIQEDLVNGDIIGGAQHRVNIMGNQQRAIGDAALLQSGKVNITKKEASNVSEHSF